MVNLSTVGVNALKAHAFATSDSDTFVTVSAGAIFDLSFLPNAIEAVAHGIQVSAYTSPALWFPSEQIPRIGNTSPAVVTIITCVMSALMWLKVGMVTQSC